MNHLKLGVLALAGALSACAALPPPPTIATPENPLAFDALPVAMAAPAGPIGPGVPPAPIPDATRFDVVARDMPAADFFMSLVEDTQENMVVPPDLAGTVTLSLRNVTLEEALDAAADLYGYDYEYSGYGYRIFADTLHSRVYHLNYLDVQREGVSRSEVSGGDMRERRRDGLSVSGRTGLAVDGVQGRRESDNESGIHIETRTRSDFWADVAVGLEQILGEAEGRKITVSPQAGVIVVTASYRELRQIEQFLDAIEGNVSRQVTLEAKILEVTLSNGYQAGVNWAAMADLGANGALNLAQTGGGRLVDGLSSVNRGNIGNLNPGNPSFPGLAGASAFGGVFSAAVRLDDFAGFIELLEQQGDVQVLSSPRVSTLNNQKAVIKVGTDQFFVTDIANTIINTGSAVTNTPSVELTPFFSGIALDVTPQISAAGMVTLHVHPTISDVRETNRSLPLGNGSRDVPLATSNVRESDSIVRARSGQVVVIGGLMQTTTEDRTAGIPGLGRAPLVGGLFRQEKRTRMKKELVILLRPVVVDDRVQRAQVARARSRYKNW